MQLMKPSRATNCCATGNEKLYIYTGTGRNTPPRAVCTDDKPSSMQTDFGQ